MGPIRRRLRPEGVNDFDPCTLGVCAGTTCDHQSIAGCGMEMGVDPDAGIVLHGGTDPDGGMDRDAGLGPDMASAPDAGAPTDAGPGTDAGPSDMGPPTGDLGMRTDGLTFDDDSCVCSATGTASASASPACNPGSSSFPAASPAAGAISTALVVRSLSCAPRHRGGAWRSNGQLDSP